MISLLLAMDENNLIGSNNDLPWHLPADLAYFKKITMGKPIVMGRKTYDSIGRPLPGRRNVILTRNKNFQAEGCEVIHSVEEVLALSRSVDDETFVIGGAEIFDLVFPITDKMYITEIHDRFEGDTYFPTFNPDDWEITSKEKGVKDEKNPYDYDYIVYERRK